MQVGQQGGEAVQEERSLLVNAGREGDERSIKTIKNDATMLFIGNTKLGSSKQFWSRNQPANRTDLN